MSLNRVCKQYRLRCVVPLKTLAGSQYKTLWAFENGQSSNLNHLKTYIDLAIENGELDLLFEMFKGVYK